MGGGIPCRPNPAATLLVLALNVVSVNSDGRGHVGYSREACSSVVQVKGSLNYSFA